MTYRFDHTDARSGQLLLTTWNGSYMRGVDVDGKVRVDGEKCPHSKRSAARSPGSGELSFGHVMGGGIVRAMCKEGVKSAENDAHSSL